MKKKTKKIPNYFLRYIISLIFGYGLALLPLIHVFVINRGKYLNPTNVTSVSFGLVIFATIFILHVKGLTKTFNGIIWTSVVFAILYFLRTIISDSLLLVSRALIGQVVFLPFKALSSYNKRLFMATREAKINAICNRDNTKEITDAISNIGRGRY